MYFGLFLPFVTNWTRSFQLCIRRYKIGSKAIPAACDSEWYQKYKAVTTWFRGLLPPPWQFSCFPALQKAALLTWSCTCSLQHSSGGKREQVVTPQLEPVSVSVSQGLGMECWGPVPCTGRKDEEDVSTTLYFSQGLPFLESLWWTSCSHRDHTRGMKEILPHDDSTLQPSWDLEPGVQTT